MKRSSIAFAFAALLALGGAGLYALAASSGSTIDRLAPKPPVDDPALTPMACQRDCTAVPCPQGCFIPIESCYDVDMGIPCCNNGGQTLSCPTGETVHMVYCKCGDDQNPCPDTHVPRCE